MLQRSAQERSSLETPLPIYLDFQATTPLDPRVLERMLPFLSGPVGNPHSTSHLHGVTASKAVEVAREQIAALIGATPEEIVFTSGATEANNLLIRGAFQGSESTGKRSMVTSSAEHKSVLEIAARLGASGTNVRTVSVNSEGLVEPDRLAAAIDDTTTLVSIMAVNNEIGVIQPLAELADKARSKGAWFHTDAAQAVGKVRVDATDFDMASIASHKLYGPSGIGAAFTARRLRKRIEPLLFGGGQEGGMRSGTLPVALCVGFGAACEIAFVEMEKEASRLLQLRDQFLAILRERGVAFEINGSLARRIAGNLNIYFPGVDAEALLMRARNIISLSTGSACTAESLEPSHVLLALGLGTERAEESVRIGFGRSTTAAEILIAADALTKAVAALAKVGYKAPDMER